MTCRRRAKCGLVVNQREAPGCQPLSGRGPDREGCVQAPAATLCRKARSMRRTEAARAQASEGRGGWRRNPPAPEDSVLEAFVVATVTPQTTHRPRAAAPTTPQAPWPSRASGEISPPTKCPVVGSARPGAAPVLLLTRLDLCRPFCSDSVPLGADLPALPQAAGVQHAFYGRRRSRVRAPGGGQ